MKLARIISQKICHDLSGNVTALNIATDILRSPNSNDIAKTALELLDSSIRDIKQEIKFASYLYGLNDEAQVIKIEEIEKFLAEKFILQYVEFDSNKKNHLSKDEVRILLLLILISKPAKFFCKFEDSEKILLRLEHKKTIDGNKDLQILIANKFPNVIDVYNCNVSYLLTLLRNNKYTLSVITKDKDIDYIISYNQPHPTD